MSEKFLNLGVAADFAAALDAMNIIEPTPIQCRTIPEALTGRDIIGQSATGTGKTFAYLLPLLQKIDPDKSSVQAIVLAPTYELAMQIYRQTELLLGAAGRKIGCASLIGGANIERQIEKLKKKPQVIIGSAGRLLELKKKGKLKLEQVETLVLDEGDKLLDDQNLASVRQVLETVGGRCQYFLFSATISPRTVNRADFMDNPHSVSLKDEIILKPDIENVYFIVEFRDKIEALRKLSSLLAVKRGLVFVNKNDTVVKVLEKLRFCGVKAAALNGDANKMERKQALESFTAGKIQLLIASDVAARGLDIADVDYVFNLDLPEDEKVYLHRAGRTGRAGKPGCAVTLTDSKEVVKLIGFAKKIKVELLAKRMINGKIVDLLRKPWQLKEQNAKNMLPSIKNKPAQGKKKI